MQGFLSVDLLTSEYPYYTPYQFAGNKPIAFIDLDGAEPLQAYMAKATATVAMEHSDASTIKQGILVQYYATKYSLEDAGSVAADIGLGLVKSAMAVPDYITNQHVVYEQKKKGNNEIADAFAEKSRDNAADIAIDVMGGAALKGVLRTAKGARASTSAALMDARKSLAKSIMKRDSYLKYIDFDKQVFTKTLKEGDELIQYRLKGNEGTYGNFYAPKGTTPEQIGLSSDEVSETLLIKVEKETKTLVSSHKRDAPYYKDESITLEGGGTQIFSRELKENITSTKIDNPKSTP